MRCSSCTERPGPGSCAREGMRRGAARRLSGGRSRAGFRDLGAWWTCRRGRGQLLFLRSPLPQGRGAQLLDRDDGGFCGDNCGRTVVVHAARGGARRTRRRGSTPAGVFRWRRPSAARPAPSRTAPVCPGIAGSFAGGFPQNLVEHHSFSVHRPSWAFRAFGVWVHRLRHRLAHLPIRLDARRVALAATVRLDVPLNGRCRPCAQAGPTNRTPLISTRYTRLRTT
jgi:hypothetical protein